MFVMGSTKRRKALPGHGAKGGAANRPLPTPVRFTTQGLAKAKDAAGRTLADRLASLKTTDPISGRALSNDEFAAAIGAPAHSTVQPWLNGAGVPAPNYLAAISQRFGVSIDWIIRGSVTVVDGAAEAVVAVALTAVSGRKPMPMRAGGFTSSPWKANSSALVRAIADRAHADADAWEQWLRGIHGPLEMGAHNIEELLEALDAHPAVRKTPDKALGARIRIAAETAQMLTRLAEEEASPPKNTVVFPSGWAAGAVDISPRSYPREELDKWKATRPKSKRK